MAHKKLSSVHLEMIAERADATTGSIGCGRSHEYKDVARLLEHIRALTEEAKKDEAAHARTIKQRDHFEEAIAEAAADLGCEDEWSSLHDHAQCIVENAATVAKERDTLKAALVHPALKELLNRMRDVHPSDLAPSLRDLRKAWLEAGRPGHKETWES